MARVISNADPSNIPKSERGLIERFKNLSDDWVVFHSILWQSIRNRRQGDGECDFVIMHPNFGILVMEVKGGGITIEDGAWYSKDRLAMVHHIKNPFQQAVDSKHALIRFMKGVTPTSSRIGIGHCVCLTDCSVDSEIGLFAPREILIDNADCLQLELKLLAVFEHWSINTGIEKSDLHIVRNRLTPTISLALRHIDRLNQSKEKLITLTKRQVDILSTLKFVPSIFVGGFAGTGKTILAIETARQLNELGFNVVLLCYNELIGDFIKSQSDAGVLNKTFHAFVYQLGKTLGLPSEQLLTRNPSSTEICGIIEQYSDSDFEKFDAIIIDEAQDFSIEWLESLWMLLDQDADSRFLLFGDANQAIYNKDWKLPIEMPQIELRKIFRNTDPIVEKISKVVGESLDSGGIEGVKPQIMECSNEEDGVEITINIVSKLLEEEGLSSEQVVILSNSNKQIENFRLRDVSGELITGYGKLGVVCESIARFKGLESDAIVLNIVDDTNFDLDNIYYVGISRARFLLYIVCTPKIRKKITW